MFDLFAPSHLLLIAIAVIVFVGPKDLPVLMRNVGRWTGKIRAMAGEFRQSFEEMDRHEEMRELREELDALRNARSQPAPSVPLVAANDETAPVISSAPATADMAAGS